MSYLHRRTLVAVIMILASANPVFAQPGAPMFYRPTGVDTKVAFAGASKFLVARQFQPIEVWDLAKKTQLLELEDVPERTLPTLKLFKNHGPWFIYVTRDLKVSPDGKIAAAAFVRM